MLFLDGDPAIPEETVKSTVSLTVTIAWAAAAIVAAYLLVTIASALINRLARGRPLLQDMALRLRRPLRALLMVVAIWVAFRISASAHQDEAWYDPLRHGLLIASIIAGAWLVGAMAFVVEDRTLARTSVASNDRHARRVQTQISILRRVTVAVIVILAVAAVLLTFPQVRLAGASILASAGLLSVVVGVAAQSSLANTIAGMQIAFTDAIRVDDVVVLDGEFGRIEEITLTYVVVHVWDDRRIILPSTYFTTTPFENWTRRAADLLGTVEIDVDFRVPLHAMRAELSRLLDSAPQWDRRTGVLEVTGATDGVVRARALVSAADAPNLWDLRCTVREGLIDWLQREAPYAMVRRRYESVEAAVLEQAEAPGAVEQGTGQGGEQGADGSGGADGAAGSSPADVPARTPRPGAPVVLPGTLTPRRDADGEGTGESDGSSKAAATRSRPGKAPRRPSVHDRQLPTPAQSAASAASAVEPAGETVLLGDVRSPRAQDATVVMAPTPTERPGLYSGSEEAEARSRNFAGPGQEAIDEREELAERRLTGELPVGDGEDGADDRRRGRLARDSGDGGPTAGPGEGGDGGGGGGDGQ
ncbi:mechanosensitive ion channel domain-containing protein [Isoptericola jiangsuensis]|uniref:mechanosensitive ion channel domain-containing protein n=1 Tax=Isoptericola jiangsuensis TaxID=548579 RepID=UPI003AAEA911